MDSPFFLLKKCLPGVLCICAVGFMLVKFGQWYGQWAGSESPPPGHMRRESPEQREMRREARHREQETERRNRWKVHVVDLEEQLVLRPIPSQSNELTQVFGQIADAYKRGHVSEMVACMDKCPGYVTNVVDYAYVRFVRPCSSVFWDEFLNKEELREFGQISVFKHYLEINMAMARFLGNLDLQRGAYTYSLVVLEAATLKRLKNYRDKFHDEGKADYEMVADRFVDAWIGHIESEEGFIRRHMWQYADFQYCRVENGSMTCKKFHDWIIRYGTSLISGYGYMPKWVGEFSVIIDEKCFGSY